MKRFGPLALVVAVIAVIAAVVAVLAVRSDEPTYMSSPASRVVPSPSPSYLEIEKTLKIGKPVEDISAFADAQRANWESTWLQSGEEVQAYYCSQWDDDWYTVLGNAQLPPELPANFGPDAYRNALGDFFMGKCGEPATVFPSSLPEDVKPAASSPATPGGN